MGLFTCIKFKKKNIVNRTREVSFTEPMALSMQPACCGVAIKNTVIWHCKWKIRQDCQAQYECGWEKMHFHHQINQNELSKPKEPAPTAYKKQQGITCGNKRK